MFNAYTSSVFGASDATLKGALKNPNLFSEAVILESINRMPLHKIREFVKSPEAKQMLEGGVISQDSMDELCDKANSPYVDTTVCHMAKEAGDPIWDELVAVRMQERRLMNMLREKYLDKAKPVADNVESDIIDKKVTPYFKQEM